MLDNITALAGQFSGTLGVVALNLTTGDACTFNAEESFNPASTIKMPILVAVYRYARVADSKLQASAQAIPG